MMKGFFTKFFNRFVRVFKELAKIAFPIAKQVAIGMLTDLAFEVIEKNDKLQIKGNEKRQMAFDTIRNHVTENLVKVSDHEINLLIEMVVSAVKNRKKD